MAIRGVNKAILAGRLGNDPETRFAANKTMVTKVSLATSRTWRDRQTNEMKEDTEWHRVVLFGRLGEIAGDYLKKGALIYIEGYLQTNKWRDQQGQDHYTAEVVAQEMQMLDSRGGSAPMGGGSGGGQNRGGQRRSGQGPASMDSGPVNDDFEDDIPF